MRRATRSLLLLATACASAAAPGAPSLGTTRFAPALAVDLSAMTAQGGVYVRDLRAGEGKAVARGTLVAVRYAGWLADGTPVDSLRAAEPPLRFRVGNHDAIAGWEQGVIGMRPGGRRQLVVPPKLAYGSTGKPPVPPDATLVFVIELVGLR